MTCSGGPQLFSFLASLTKETYSASEPLNWSVPPCANSSDAGRRPRAPTVAATPPKNRRRESGCLTFMSPPRKRRLTRKITRFRRLLGRHLSSVAGHGNRPKRAPHRRQRGGQQRHCSDYEGDLGKCGQMCSGKAEQ